MNKKDILRDNYYFIIVFVILIITLCGIFLSRNILSTNEKKAYLMIKNVKNEFKNPDAVKVLSAKICNDDYGIFKISSTNGFGGTVTSYYYINKGTLSDKDDAAASGVVDKCFELEKNKYDSVFVLSEKSINKVNKKLKGDK